MMNSLIFQRVTAVALALAGILIALFWILHPEESLLLTNPAGYQQEHFLGFIGTLLLPLGLVGLYGRFTQTKSIRLGLAGFMLAFISALLSLTVNAVDTFVWPAIAQMQPNLILTAEGHFDETSSVFSATFPLIMTAVFLVLVGYTLLSIALWQAKIVPRPAAVLLAIAAILSTVGSGFILHTNILLNVLIYTPIAAAFVWLGVVIWSGTLEGLPHDDVKLQRAA
jgi:hypothetical protein